MEQKINKAKLTQSLRLENIDEKSLQSAQEIFQWISLLQGVNTEGVEPLINPTELYANKPHPPREDVIKTSPTLEELVKYTSCKESGFFEVPKVKQ